MGGINYRLKVLYDDDRLTIQICILPLPWPFLQHYSVFYETQLLTCVKATKLANFQIALWRITFGQTNGKIMQNKNIPPAPFCSQ